MSSIPTFPISGDLSVSHNVAIGGDEIVRGDVTIDHNLSVKGWFDAPNIKAPNKGLFASKNALESAYPIPQPGWYAFVGNTLPAAIYRSDGEKWIASGEEGGQSIYDDSFINAQLNSIKDSINELCSEKADAQVNDGEHQLMQLSINNLSQEIQADQQTMANFAENLNENSSAISALRNTVNGKANNFDVSEDLEFLTTPAFGGFEPIADGGDGSGVNQQSEDDDYLNTEPSEGGENTGTGIGDVSDKGISDIPRKLCLSNSFKNDLTSKFANKADKNQNSLDHSILQTGIDEVTPILDRDSDLRRQAKLDLFIDMWNEACSCPEKIGSYNSSTGFFELNGLTDITYEEALRIYDYKDMPWIANGNNGWAMRNVKLRTNIFHIARIVGQDILAWGATIDYFRVSRDETISNAVTSRHIIMMPNCIKVIGIINAPESLYLDSCRNLESIKVYGINKNLDFSTCAKLSLDSLTYMVQNAANTSAITITVHPDVYAHMSPNPTEEWSQLLALAEQKNISFATV